MGILLAAVVAYLGFLWVAAGRVQQMQDGMELPDKGLINRFAHYQRRRLAAQGRWSAKAPPGSAAEVDARTKEARLARMRAAAPEREQRTNAEGRDWLPRDKWVSAIDNPAIPESGLWARFEYVDFDGVITSRHIRRWSKRGAYIEGFCMDRREGRTFRQDRITSWVYG